MDTVYVVCRPDGLDDLEYRSGAYSRPIAVFARLDQAHAFVTADVRRMEREQEGAECIACVVFKMSVNDPIIL